MTEFPELKFYIDGEWTTGTGTGGEDVINPADEAVLGRLAHASRQDLERALAAAERGFATWRRTSPARRAEIIVKAVNLIRQRVDAIAEISTREQGKPVAESKAEVLRGCDIMEWDAHEGLRTYGRIIPSEYGMRRMVLREPIGVVAGFSPWNFPASSPARKIGGALAAGCSIILKASEETPATAVMVVRAFADAGLPPGVLNLVFGVPAEVSEFLIPQPSVRLLTFTGSTAVGKHLAELCGRHMKPCLMELGGHAPVIVCEDFDPEKAAKIAVAGKFRNAGQVCVSPTRFIVHQDIYQRFVKSFADNAARLKVGNGLEPGVQVGALVNRRRLDAMQALVADATARGARLVTGGKRVGNSGFFFAPTVLADVPDDARVMTDEPFGPLAPIVPFKTLEDAVKRANSLRYGLAGYAFTNSSASFSYLADNVEVGNLAVNHTTASWAETPFGGVKDSGYGREGGNEGLYEYTVTKLVSQLNDGV
jgi:succinate-semialdehyde dehydrogenase/glutarate-semialdehyde dehydrogenase